MDKNICSIFLMIIAYAENRI